MRGGRRSSPAGSKQRKCAVPDLDEPTATRVENKLDRLLPVEPDRQSGSITIDVHVHVITDGTGGIVPQEQAQAQVDEMDGAYAGGQATGAANTAYRFRLASYDVVTNAAWYGVAFGSPEERDMKTALHRGGPSALDVDPGETCDTGSPRATARARRAATTARPAPRTHCTRPGPATRAAPTTR